MHLSRLTFPSFLQRFDGTPLAAVTVEEREIIVDPAWKLSSFPRENFDLFHRFLGTQLTHIFN